MKTLTLLALAGCLQTPPFQGQGDAPPAFVRGVQLVHQIATTEVVPPGVIGEPALELAPIAPAPLVRVGPESGELVASTYDPATGDVDIAAIEAPFATRWRLEYTLSDGVPHEVSWTPEDGARLVVPVVGRLDRGTLPASSGYDVRPVGVAVPPPSPGAFSSSHIFTTGVFLDAATGTSPADAKLDVANTRFDGAELGQPDQARGDFAVVVNYTISGGNCPLLANGYAGFRPPAVAANQQVAPAPQPTWSTATTVNLALSYTKAGGLDARLAQALGSRSGTSLLLLGHGFVANKELPAFTTTKSRAPSPLLFPLATCALDPAFSGMAFVVPNDLAKFPRVTYARVSDTRSLGGGASLASNLVTVADVAGNTSNLDFAVPLTAAPVLTAGAEAVSLDGASDDIPLPPGTDAFELRFDLEPDAGANPVVADYFEVGILRIDGVALVPIRTYITTAIAAPAEPPRTIATPIRIDRGLFEPGDRYVFAIRAVRGRPNVNRGDFATVAFPQAMTTVFTRTVVAP